MIYITGLRFGAAQLNMAQSIIWTTQKTCPKCINLSPSPAILMSLNIHYTVSLNIWLMSKICLIVTYIIYQMIWSMIMHLLELLQTIFLIFLTYQKSLNSNLTIVPHNQNVNGFSNSDKTYPINKIINYYGLSGHGKGFVDTMSRFGVKEPP